MSKRLALALVTMAVSCVGADASRAFASANVGSPIATNLTAVEDYHSEYPFIDFAKQARPWFGGTIERFDDGTMPAIDGHGNVTSLAPGKVARTLLFDGLPADPDLVGRRFVVRYDGEGTIGYQLGARVISRQPRRDVIELTGNGPGESNLVVIVLSATAAANPLRNLRLTPEGGICAADSMRRVASSADCPGGDFLLFETNASAVLFNPEFLDRIKTYSGLRFMDWMRTNNSAQREFGDRPEVADQFWSTPAGVPLEVMIALANTLDADPWFNIPHNATDAYVREFAITARDGLETGRMAHVEYSNEVWNGQFPQTTAVRDRADALNLGMIDHDGDPSTPDVEDRTIGMLRLYSRRSREIHQIFSAEFGGTRRLRRVMASQAVVPFFTDTILGFENAAAGVDAFAIAPYFGDTAATSEQVQAYKELGVDGLFDWLSGTRVEPRLELNLPRVDKVVADQVAVVGRYGVPLVAYEGGQHLLGVDPSDSGLNAVLNAANRDPRMHDIYITYLTNWRARTRGSFWHFQNCDRWSGFGRWGALEYQSQPRGAAPKFDALQDFIEANSEPDTQPEPFAFVEQTGVDPRTRRFSNTITISGINRPTTISVSGPSSAYSVNGAAAVTAAGMVVSGDTVRVQHLSSTDSNTTVVTTLTVGGVTGVFRTTTNAKDINPEPFVFKTRTGVAPDVFVSSDVIVPRGFDAPARIQAGAGTLYRLDSGSFTSVAGTIRPGQTLQVRHRSATTPSTQKTTTVRITNTQGVFTTRTR